MPSLLPGLPCGPARVTAPSRSTPGLADACAINSICLALRLYPSGLECSRRLCSMKDASFDVIVRDTFDGGKVAHRTTGFLREASEFSNLKFVPLNCAQGAADARRRDRLASRRVLACSIQDPRSVARVSAVIFSSLRVTARID